jgi:hypothetical protein
MGPFHGMPNWEKSMVVSTHSNISKKTRQRDDDGFIPHALALTPDVSNPCSARSICQNVSPTYHKRDKSVDIPGHWNIYHTWLPAWPAYNMVDFASDIGWLRKEKTDLDINDFTRRHIPFYDAMMKVWRKFGESFILFYFIIIIWHMTLLTLASALNK